MAGQQLAVLRLRLLDRRQRLGMLIHRFLDVEHGVADRADGLVLLVDSEHEPGDFRASHAGQHIERR